MRPVNFGSVSAKVDGHSHFQKKWWVSMTGANSGEVIGKGRNNLFGYVTMNMR
jgi:hypothetical protein